jgi:hypothetical protein
MKDKNKLNLPFSDPGQLLKLAMFLDDFLTETLPDLDPEQRTQEYLARRDLRKKFAIWLIEKDIIKVE